MKTSLLLLTGLTVLVAGCVGMLTSYNYNLALRNIGRDEIWCSLIASTKGIAHEPGRVVPGANATFAGPFTHPYADKWTVAWKTATGQNLEKSLDLTHQFPRRFEGRLVFTIDTSNNMSYVTETFSGK